MIPKLLIGAGAMKAGTTWLYKQLEPHPYIQFTPEKEIHYFSFANGFGNKLRHDERIRKHQKAISRNLRRKTIRWYQHYARPRVLNDQWYCNLFRDIPDSIYCADFSNQYALLPEKALEQILRISDDVKVIYTLRDPLARLWSHVKFQYKFIGEENKVNQISDDDFEKIIGEQWFWSNAEYVKNYRRLVNVFGKERVRLLYLEDFIAFPQGSLWGIEKFLNIPHIDYSAKSSNKKINKTKEIIMPDSWERIARERLQPIYEELFIEDMNHPAWHGETV